MQKSVHFCEHSKNYKLLDSRMKESRLGDGMLGQIGA